MRLALGALLSAVALAGLVGCGHIPVPASGQPVNGPALTSPSEAPLPGATDVKPTSLDVSSINAHSSLIPLGVDPKTGETIVPDDHHPEQAGWLLVKSKTPDKIAPLVILGHVDGYGRPGVFIKLKTISVGAKVSLGMSDGTTRTYTITKFRQVSKTGFPTSAVYDGTSDSEIRLITCGGPLDTKAHNYLDSEIAFGVQDPAK